jgi:uncharacterized alkaline shock family protein YloU
MANTQTASGNNAQETPGESSTPARQGSSSPLQTERGNTTIADSVVTKIASVAAQEVAGVHEMGSGASRTIGSLKDRFLPSSPESGVGRGVSVEVGERQAAVDLDLIIDYGVSIPDVASAVRTNVTNRVERMTGLEIVEVNIYVDDVYLGWADQEKESKQIEKAAAQPSERVQ